MSIGSCFFCALMVVSVLSSGCQSEFAKWEFARGLEAEESGDLSSAIAHMQTAVAKLPENAGMKLELATVLAEQGDRESLTLCDQVLAKYPSRKSALLSKANCQQHLGEFEEALATYKLVLSDHVKLNEAELNNLAYFRALANRELELAATDIEKAIDQVESKRWPSGLYLPLRIKSAMAMGLICRQLDQQQEVIGLLNEQIGSLETDYANFQAVVSLTIFAQIQTEFPLSKTTEKETELIRNNRDLIRACLASLLVVRALVHQDLEQFESANADRLRIRDLDYDADQLAEKLPNKFACLDLLSDATTYLDTRGYILGLLPWDDIAWEDLNLDTDSPVRISSYREAMSDLDMAVSAAKTIRIAIDGSFYNVPEFSVADVKRIYRQMTRIEAVLRYHRSQIAERAGKTDRSERDRQEIRLLGFDPAGEPVLGSERNGRLRLPSHQRSGLPTIR